MKKVSFFVAATMLVTGIAQARSVIAPERPLYRSALTATGTTRGPLATQLTLNQRIGSRQPTSFTVTEDTGIRCITTPCPSSKNTRFNITGVHASFHGGGTVRYEAIEVLTNIPPNVRIAPRHLNVTEYSMELVAPGGGGFMRRLMWEVEVRRFSRPSQTYSGRPRAIAPFALTDEE